MNNEDNPGSILLIEDNQDIAEMVFAYFESRGYAVDYAADGLTGLHLAVTQDFDAIVLDLMLPGMDGLDLCDKLRREGRRSTPILMLTARDTLEDKVAGLEVGADDYLIKPFEMRELEARYQGADTPPERQRESGNLQGRGPRAGHRNPPSDAGRQGDPDFSNRPEDSHRVDPGVTEGGEPARGGA
jgi:DNA-binding response OmpR family regulator